MSKLNNLICRLFLFVTFLGFVFIFSIPPSEASAPVYPKNSFVGMLYSAGPKDALGIYDVANASGAINVATPQDKEKAFSVIQKAFDDYMKAHPGASAGPELYRAVEVALGRQRLLTYNVALPKELPATVKKETKSTQDLVTAPRVQTPATFNDKFFAKLNNVPLDTYRIYGILEKSGFLSDKAHKERKAVVKLISEVVKPEQLKLQEKVSGPLIQEIMNKLSSQGYLNKP
ncbi:MAG: hypothetical protein SFU25_04325 [Candidatus Caenarcaniphilales bacterium]|nr:hypothetical protein [Candidatus Caenarcaniphilales bacterium]